MKLFIQIILSIPLMFLLSCIEEPKKNTIHIEINGSVAAPFKSSKELWDCCGSIDDETWEAFYQLSLASGLVTLSAPASELLQYVTNLTVSHTSYPETYGYAYINVGRGWETPIALTAATQNTLINSYNSVGWSNVNFSENLSIKIELFDEDVSEDDVMGTAIIGYEDIKLLLEEKKVIDVYIGDQTSRQVLFLKMNANYE